MTRTSSTANSPNGTRTASRQPRTGERVNPDPKRNELVPGPPISFLDPHRGGGVSKNPLLLRFFFFSFQREGPEGPGRPAPSFGGFGIEPRETGLARSFLNKAPRKVSQKPGSRSSGQRGSVPSPTPRRTAATPGGPPPSHDKQILDREARM